jgi:hypothetical protein
MNTPSNATKYHTFLKPLSMFVMFLFILTRETMENTQSLDYQL